VSQIVAEPTFGSRFAETKDLALALVWRLNLLIGEILGRQPGSSL
jgi:hypothetical protein